MSGRRGRSGPRKRPTAMHLVDGTFRPDEHGSREAAKQERDSLRGAPKLQPPARLSPTAKAEWRRVVPVLQRKGVVGKLDRSVLSGYCQAWAEFIEAQASVAKDGRVLEGAGGGAIRNPDVLIAAQASKRMVEYGIQLGLTPSARAGMAPKESTEPGLTDFPSRQRERANERGA